MFRCGLSLFGGCFRLTLRTGLCEIEVKPQPNGVSLAQKIMLRFIPGLVRDRNHGVGNMLSDVLIIIYFKWNAQA